MCFLNLRKKPGGEEGKGLWREPTCLGREELKYTLENCTYILEEYGSQICRTAHMFTVTMNNELVNCRCRMKKKANLYA